MAAPAARPPSRTLACILLNEVSLNHDRTIGHKDHAVPTLLTCGRLLTGMVCFLFVTTSPASGNDSCMEMTTLPVVKDAFVAFSGGRFSLPTLRFFLGKLSAFTDLRFPTIFNRPRLLHVHTLLSI